MTNICSKLNTVTLINPHNHLGKRLVDVLQMKKGDILFSAGRDNNVLYATLNRDQNNLLQEIQQDIQPLAYKLSNELEQGNDQFVSSFLKGISQTALKTLRDRQKQQELYSKEYILQKLKNNIQKATLAEDPRVIISLMDNSDDCLAILNHFIKSYSQIQFPEEHYMHQN